MRGIPAAAAPRAALLSVLLYLAALAAPVFAGHAGAALLVFGWHEMFAWRSAGALVAFAWLANPLLLAAWSCAYFRAWRLAAALAAPAVALALAVSFGSRLVVREGGAPLPLPHLGGGYWLWVASLAAALLAAVLGARRAATRGAHGAAPLTAAHGD